MEEKNQIYTLGLVAIVAVVGIVFLILNSSNAPNKIINTQSSELSNDDVGQAYKQIALSTEIFSKSQTDAFLASNIEQKKLYDSIYEKDAKVAKNYLIIAQTLDSCPNLRDRIANDRATLSTIDMINDVKNCRNLNSAQKTQISNILTASAKSDGISTDTSLRSIIGGTEPPEPDEMLSCLGFLAGGIFCYFDPLSCILNGGNGIIVNGIMCAASIC